MRIRLNSVPVGDQSHALAFYTDVLGFRMKRDIPIGEYRWLTVVADNPKYLDELEKRRNDAAKQARDAHGRGLSPAVNM